MREERVENIVVVHVIIASAATTTSSCVVLLDSFVTCLIVDPSRLFI